MANKALGAEIRILSNLIQRSLEHSHNKKMADRITGANARIICYLAKRSGQDTFQKDLEAEFGITRSTASKVLNLMEKKGLVERQGVPYDARLRKLVLTQTSDSVFQLMEQDLQQVEHVLTAGFTEKETDQLFSYLHRMQDNLKSAGSAVQKSKRHIEQEPL